MKRILLLPILVLFMSGSAAGAQMQAGVAVVDITPPVGYRMSGYFHERPSTGTHDPLLAKAIVLRQGDRQAALVFCDIIGIAADVSRQTRQLAEEKTGIPVAGVVIVATHSHTGPLYAGALREHFHNKAVAGHGHDPREAVDYSAELVKKLVRLIADAQAAAGPIKLWAGIARQEGLAFNRRFHMKDGSVRFNPGFMNPNIVRSAGPVDPDVGILLFRRAADERPLVSLTVFALHLDTVGGTEYSADYPYYLAESLREELGEGFVSMFGNGTCGDINHLDVSHPRPQLKQHQWTRQIGQTLAATVKDELGRLKELESPALGIRREIVDVALQRFTPEEIAWAEQAMDKVGTRELSFLEQVKAYKIMALKWRGGASLPLEVQAIRLGEEVAIVALPGEVFVELGLAIKKASPFATTLVIELANDAPGYVPTRKAFAEGSYETVNSRIQGGGGEMAVAAAGRLLKQLKAELP